MPNQYHSNFEHSDEIDLAKLWKTLWNHKIIIVMVTAFFSIASVIYYLMNTKLLFYWLRQAPQMELVG